MDGWKMKFPFGKAEFQGICWFHRGYALFFVFGRLDRNWISSSALGDYLGAIIGSMVVVGVTQR